MKEIPRRVLIYSIIPAVCLACLILLPSYKAYGLSVNVRLFLFMSGGGIYLAFFAFLAVPLIYGIVNIRRLKWKAFYPLLIESGTLAVMALVINLIEWMAK